jgi:methionine-rich copper-binding protein CopC
VKQLPKHLTYANVVSTVCLFLLVGGGAAIAATQLPAKSVGPKQIKKNAVTTAKIRKSAVTTARLKNGAVTAAKLGAAAVSSEAIADSSVTTTKVADSAVNSAKVLDKSLTGGDVANDTLTGANIDESTLGQVPDAARLEGKAAAAFTSSDIYKKESALEQGTSLGDGTYYIDEACNPGDVLLDGGPADVNGTSVMVESFPTPGTTNSWRARIKPAATDEFLVVVLCAKQG